MPELPEVETVCRGLELSLAGDRVTRVMLRRKGLRTEFPKDFEEKVTGSVWKQVTRRAKYIVVELDNGHTILAHLGMSGRMIVHHAAPNRFETHDHAVFYFASGKMLMFNDARRFGVLTLVPTQQLNQHPLLRNLGVEPLEKEFSAAYLKTMLAARSAPIKTALMDQRVVVGVGNIYAAEALFLAGISPLSPARNSAPHAAAIIRAVQKVLKAAIASGGSTLRDYVRSSGEAGYFQHTFNVYGREGKPCVTCRTPIIRITQSGRSTFYCGKCQR